MSWGFLRFSTIRRMVSEWGKSEQSGNERSTLVSQVMFPLQLAVPSTLKALTGLDRGEVSRFSLRASWVSMKLPVAPLSMMAVVS